VEPFFKAELYRIAAELYQGGPAQMKIWSRSGGDLSYLFIGQAGRDAWYDAIEQLDKGGGGHGITPQRLIAEMLSDYPGNTSLLQLKTKLSAEVEQINNQDTADTTEVTYVAEEQPWFVATFPETHTASPTELSTLVPEIEIFILTATEIELKYVLSYFRPTESRSAILQGAWGNDTYYVGKYGEYNAVAAKSEMGHSAVGAAMLATEEGLRLWQPRATFMVGIAFAKNTGKQHIGQVLVAKSIIPYDNQRIGDTVIDRGIPLPSDATLLNRFENAIDWRFGLPDGNICRKESGPILSAEKLVDNLEFRNNLFSRFPQAIGGEMEGAGFYAAAYRKRVPCLLLKSICDWGDGQKHKKHQPLAAATSNSLLHHVLSNRYAL
jgi:nucleoside phosphorylase